MKLKQLLLKPLLALSLISTFIACSKDDGNPEDSKSEQNSSYSLFLIDTARIKSLNNDGSNVKLITQVNQGSTKSVFISAMSANPARTKIAYMARKGDSPNYSTELRIVDFNGSNDKLLVALNDNSAMPGNVKFGNDGKVYYNYSLGTTQKFFSVKDDGTSNTSKGSHKFEDLSNDGRYLLKFGFSLDPTATPVQVLDLSGDGGAGSGKFYKSFSVPLRSIKLSSDGSKVAGIYRDGASIKLIIADINTNTTVEKTLGTSSDTWSLLFLSFAPDNKTLVCTSAGTESKTWIYSIENGTSTSFTNINKDVSHVYAF